jgi:3(or 17)beta-hydroxysteroid dehydrogenase
MTKSIAVHCQTNKYNIRCNSIHPGAIETQMVRDSSKELGLDISVFRDAPGGLGQPADVANVVVFLASDESLRERRGDPDRQRAVRAVIRICVVA